MRGVTNILEIDWRRSVLIFEQRIGCEYPSMLQTASIGGRQSLEQLHLKRLEDIMTDRCDSEVFRKGKGVCTIYGNYNAVERWVRLVAQKSGARVDWHYSGGRANVLHLGNKRSRRRVLKAIKELESELEGYILSIGGPALYRHGVDPPFPKGTIGFY